MPMCSPPSGGAAVSGMTDDVAKVLHAYDEVATGGTLFANPLPVAARAALTEVLTPDAFITTARLGEARCRSARVHRPGQPPLVGQPLRLTRVLLLQPTTRR
jgi:hypothetical protein